MRVQGNLRDEGQEALEPVAPCRQGIDRAGVGQPQRHDENDKGQDDGEDEGIRVVPFDHDNEGSDNRTHNALI